MEYLDTSLIYIPDDLTEEEKRQRLNLILKELTEKLNSLYVLFGAEHDEQTGGGKQ